MPSVATRTPFPARRQAARLLIAVGTLGMLAGCRLIVGTTAVAVGTVGLVGYGAYKTGEAAVTGIGSAVSSGAKSIGSVVFVNGEFKTTGNGSVEEVWLASAAVLKEHGFRLVAGDRDALTGHLKATTWDNTEIVIRLANAGNGQTDFYIRIGVTGDLKQSENLYALISQRVARTHIPQPQGGS